MGGPRHVLAGTYSREALVYFGWLETFFYRTVWTVDVRSALNFVERGEAAAGTAYAMDARLSEKVKTAALVSGACGRAREILNFFPPPPRQD
ncbi:MAG: hypothetical protein HZA01_10915 [Nitrospinae bacterium]|nr:hypothetical protein [Nitrospinota bacterium]